MSKLDAWINESPEHAREFAQERLIAEVAEEIWASMERAHLNNTDLAQRLGKSKAFIGQVLNGSRNMTLRTLSDIAGVMNLKVQVSLHNAKAIAGWQPMSGASFAQFRPTVVLKGAIEVSNGDQWQNFEGHESSSLVQAA